MSVEILTRQAEKLEAERRYLEAGAVWEKAFESERAAQAYRRGGRPDRAARLLELLGRADEAAALYAASGQHSRAGALYEGRRMYGQAARAYLNANQRERAALMCELGELFEDAAKIYSSLSNFPKAAQLFERAGRTDLAASLRAQHAEAVPEPAAEAGPDTDAVLEDPAALLDERRVVQLLIVELQRGDVEKAARLYSACRTDVGFPLIAALAGRGDPEVRLAQMLYAAKDYHKAAQVLESLGSFAKASQLYERADDPERAADMALKSGDGGRAAELYERAGRHGDAAELYELAGRLERAASCFERVQSCFRAGELYRRAGKADKALELLQRVQSGEPDFLPATRILVELLSASGRPELAIPRMVMAVQTHPAGEESAPIYYSLAVALEQKGNVTAARKVLERLAAWRPGYEDVQVRLSHLAAGVAPPAPQAEAQLATLEAPPAAGRGEVVSLMEGFEFLKNAPLFGELSLDELRAFYNFATIRSFAPGEVLIDEGRPGTALYIIRSGEAVVTKGGAERVLARLGPGSPLGEMSLFDDAPTSARVSAATPVAVLELSRARFLELLSGSDRLALKIYRVFIRTLTARLRDTTAQRAGG